MPAADHCVGEARVERRKGNMHVGREGVGGGGGDGGGKRGERRDREEKRGKERFIMRSGENMFCRQQITV